MELLRLVTLFYAAVLVLALAVSLTAIWIHLRRIGGALGEAYEALALVEQRTRPLEELLEPLNPALNGSARDLHEAAARMHHVDRALDSLAERLGAGAISRTDAGGG